MSVINTKLFTVIGGLTGKPVTILVETVKPLGQEPLVVLETLEGVYDSREEFEASLDYTIKGWEKGWARDKDEKKMWKIMYLNVPGAKKLVYVLNEVLEASEEG